MENYPQPHTDPSSLIPAPPLSPQEERTWAMLAHLSILVNLFTFILGPAISFFIYHTFKDRSRYVAYQALQATVFQVICWGGSLLLFLITVTITAVLIPFFVGICLVPFALLTTVVPVVVIIYGVIAGFQCNQGADFQYYYLGPWLTQKIK